MSDIVIRAEGLGKRYRIGERERYLALRDLLARAASAPVRLFAPRKPSAFKSNGNHPNGNHSNGDESHIWALKDVSFDIRQGEVVGIIGRNGAGKSTLLKILARVTKPTTGVAEVRGRMGTLLEVGTGFHPELTGRENVFLSGAILGMSKSEIHRKFDEIVAFAEVEKFIDTPLKHYSSGMQMRLAFAVAAHLEPEILLVDEVLAVGDMAFQKKCLGKMQDVAKQGRTVLFVSHNMGTINHLCSRALWMDHGCHHLDGPAREVVSSYVSAGLEDAAECCWPPEKRPGDEHARLCSVRMCQPAGTASAAIDITRPFFVEVQTEVLRRVPEMAICIRILSVAGEVLLHTNEVMSRGEGPRDAGMWVTTCHIPAYAFNVGKYVLSVAADIPRVKIIFEQESILTWSVEPLSSEMARYGSASWGGVLGPGLVSWNAHRLHEGLGELA